MKKTVIFLFVITSIQVFPQDPKILWDTIMFDTACEYVTLDTSAANIWQIGTPQKTYFDSAYSNGICLVTDTINPYPVNNNSYFEIKVGSFNHHGYPWSVYFEITHKYDTDPHRDGGYITVSHDGGETWKNIINDYDWNDGGPFWLNENLYYDLDTIGNGESGFSGLSDGWIKTYFGWQTLPASIKSTNWPSEEDTMLLRFNFYSDSVDNSKEGWLIDNIRFYEIEIGGGPIKYRDKLAELKIYPIPVNDKISVEFDKNYADILIEIYSVNGSLMFKERYSNCNKVELNNLTLKSGIYQLRCSYDGKQTTSQVVFIKD